MIHDVTIGTIGTVPTAAETTNEAVVAVYAANMLVINQILKKDPTTTSVSDANTLRIAINNLKSLAQTGVAAVDTYAVGQPIKTFYMTTNMAQQLDLLLRTLSGSGINTDADFTVPNVTAWQLLGPQGLDQVMAEAVYAISNNRSLQALIQTEYIQSGNEVLTAQLDSLQKAMQANSTVLDLLNQLQDIHNQVEPVTPPVIDPIFTDPASVFTARQNQLWAVITDPTINQNHINNTSSGYSSSYDTVQELMTGLNITSAGDITTEFVDSLILASAGDTSSGVGDNGLNHAMSDGRAAYTVAGINPADLEPKVTYGLQSFIVGDPNASPPIVGILTTDQAQQVAGSDTIDPDDVKDQWNVAGSGGSSIRSVLTQSQYDQINNWISLNWGYSTKLGAVPTAIFDHQGLSDYGVDTSTAYLAAAKIAYSSAIAVQANYHGKNPQSYLQEIQAIRNKLNDQLAILNQLSPPNLTLYPSTNGINPDTTAGKIYQVLRDLDSTIGTVDFNNPSAAIGKLATWIIDNQNPVGGTVPQSVGTFQRNMDTAISAATNLNTTQQQQFQRYTFIFQQFYQSASAMLNSIHQIITQMAQNAGR